jgi:CBS domain containing-hemolysin-like protein
MSTALGIAAVVLLTLGTGYFVAVEFAFVAVDRNRVEEAAAHGDRRAADVLKVLRRLSFMLSGAQLGITLTTLVVGFIAADAFEGALRPLLEAVGVPETQRRGIAVIVGFLVATIGQMLVGELAPKNLAIAVPDPVSRGLAGSLNIFLRVSGPVIRLFDNASTGLLRLLGIEPVEELSYAASPDELGVILQESGTEGSLDPALARLLDRVLDFRDLTASEAATPARRVVTLEADATCADLASLMASGRSRFPIVEDSEVVGVVHVRDLLQVPRPEWATTPVTTIMSEPVLVPETARLPNVLRTLRSAGNEMAVVLDEHGTFVGVVTAEDMAEELVGDIDDETDARSPRVRPLGPGRWRVPGTYRIDEVERATGVVLPEGDYETVAGLILTELGRMAEVGDRAEVGGACLVVTRTEGHAITGVRLEVLERPDAEGESQA